MKKVAEHWKLIIGLFIGLIFMYLAFRKVDFSKVMDHVSEASLFWVIIFTATVLLGHFIRTIRWKIILHSIKPDAKLINLFGALMIGYGVNCVTPKLGEVTRAIMLGRYENLSKSSMFGTVIVERVIDIIALGISVLVSAFIWSSSLYITFIWLESALYITTALMIIVLLVIFLSVKLKERFYGAILRLVGKISQKLAARLGYIFEMLIQGFASLKGTRNYIYTIIITVILLLVYALGSYLGFLMLGMQSIMPITFLMGWILMSISSIGVVIPTPGATGSYHALAISTLVLLFGFNETISAAYAFLTHIISYFLFIITALIMFFLLNKQHASLLNIFKTNTDGT